jgi:CBS domain-containing protein
MGSRGQRTGREAPMKIETLLQKKGRNVVTAKPDATLLEVAELLRQHQIGCVVVSEDGKHIDGIVAVRDIAYAFAAAADRIRAASGGAVLDVPIRRIMKQEVHTCAQQDTLRHVMKEMTTRHILHVPVVENGVLCGIVSNDDVVKFAVEEMELEKGVLQDSLLIARTLDDLR